MKYCSRCVLDENIPDIFFDDNGECNYCKQYDALSKDYPRGEKGQLVFEELISKIKKGSRRKKYDCIVGVSGGTDSTYLLWLCKKYDLRVLAVNIDNGWHSEIAVNNIKNSLDILKYDLETYVIDWEEMKSIHLAFMKESLPWPDGVSDMAINGGLYHIAKKYKIKYVFNGHDFRTEGKQPTEWTWTDGKMIKSICKKNKIKIRTFPNLSIFQLLYYGSFLRIKDVRPLWYLNYSKIEAKKIIEKELNWRYYGGHHHENIFTRYIIGVWMPYKFNIDKRKITFSAQIRGGEADRNKCIELTKLPAYDKLQMKNDEEFICKKLGIDHNEMFQIWKAKNKKFSDIPSYYNLFSKFGKIASFFFKLILNYKPMSTYSLKKSND